MEYIAGIDLGTTNSEIAIVRENIPEILLIDNQKMMPSCVAFSKDNGLLIGRVAKNQMILNPDNTILSIKRKMGRDVTVKLNDRNLKPEEVSSLILRELIKHANNSLNANIKKAVITVPAYFDDDQRKATMKAGELAGINVVRIINEPTAAALAYDYDLEKDQKILVYDLGGGTFDASVVVIESGVVEVKSSHGDTRLGGDDFDNLLIDYIAKNFSSKHSIDLREYPVSYNRLWNAAEKAKCTLSDAPFAYIKEEYIYEDLHLDMEISRDEYEDMIKPLVDKTMDCVHTALKDAQYLPGDIDTIILAGGSTRTPLVTELIENEFGKVPKQIVDPDTIVALGAAVQAEVMAGGIPHSVLVDITPHSFGTMAVGEYAGMITHDMFVPVIKRNTSIPTQKSESFSTLFDNQESVIVKIFEGEDPVASNNKFIGEFGVKGLSRSPAGNIIILKLNLDNNGILEVTAQEKITGLEKTVVMHTRGSGETSGVEASKENISELITDVQQISDFIEDAKVVDVTVEESGDNRQLLATAKQLRQRSESIIESIDEVDSKEINELLSQSRQAIADKNFEKLSTLNESLSDMLFYLEE